MHLEPAPTSVAPSSLEGVPDRAGNIPRRLWQLASQYAGSARDAPLEAVRVVRSNATLCGCDPNDGNGRHRKALRWPPKQVTAHSAELTRHSRGRGVGTTSMQTKPNQAISDSGGTVQGVLPVQPVGAVAAR